jgi:6-pyruvoyltetrahydropterin/6-carboxytetrahydropterin synthase
VEMWRIFAGFAESMDYPQLGLERIAIEETGNNSFEYFGEGTPLRKTLG